MDIPWILQTVLTLAEQRIYLHFRLCTLFWLRCVVLHFPYLLHFIIKQEKKVKKKLEKKHSKSTILWSPSKRQTLATSTGPNDKNVSKEETF